MITKRVNEQHQKMKHAFLKQFEEDDDFDVTVLVQVIHNCLNTFT